LLRTQIGQWGRETVASGESKVGRIECAEGTEGKNKKNAGTALQSLGRPRCIRGTHFTKFIEENYPSKGGENALVKGEKKGTGQ